MVRTTFLNNSKVVSVCDSVASQHPVLKVQLPCCIVVMLLITVTVQSITWQPNATPVVTIIYQKVWPGMTDIVLIAVWTMQIWTAVMEALAVVPVCGCGFQSPVQRWGQGGSETH